MIYADTMKENFEKFDVMVIGGGPSGMMAAGRAAELGAKTALLEKNKNLGRKLLITGKGRCNITQARYNDREFIEKIGKKGRFLFSALAAFGPKEVIKFFQERRLATKIERGGRIFPKADSARDVLNVLLNYLKQNKVKIMTAEEVLGFEVKDGKIESVKLKNKKIYADKFILSTGGKSYPATGSTGDGYGWAAALGHHIINPAPALVPIKIKESWVKNLQGLSLKNVELNVFQNGKKQETRFGEMLFTHFGISGPIVLDVSGRVGELLKGGQVLISIDSKPALDGDQLDQRLQRDFRKNLNKDFKNYLPELLPRKLIETIIYLSGIDSGKKVNSITRDERKRLVGLLKDVRLTAEGLMGFNMAIITSGGVDLKEIDPKTMQSKIIGNLFFAGEVLDLDGPSGGYNLQICWSTGYAAGTYAAIGNTDLRSK